MQSIGYDGPEVVKISPRGVKRRISGGRNALIVPADYPQAAVFAGISGQYFRAVVGTAVVNTDGFKIRKCLR